MPIPQKISGYAPVVHTQRTLYTLGERGNIRNIGIGNEAHRIYYTPIIRWHHRQAYV